MNTTFDNDDERNDLVEKACAHLHNKNYPAAERLLRQALAHHPGNCPALNALVVLYESTGRHSQALGALRLAMALHPTDPNAYYNLASLLHQDGRSEESLVILEQLFTKAEPRSPGSVAAYSQAITLCEYVQDALATKNHPAACEAVAVFRRSVESLTGYPVVVVLEDLPRTTGSITEPALCSGRSRHLIRCNRSFPDTMQQHFIARGLMHIDIDSRARSAGKATIFTSTDQTIRFMFGLFQPQLNRLKAQGRGGEPMHRAALERAHSLLLNLFSGPIDLSVETRLRHGMPALAAAQFLAMSRLLRQAPDPSRTLNEEELTPRSLVCAGLALNCVRAQLHDLLFRGATGFALAYTDTEVFPLASRLWDHWQSTLSSNALGDEYRLVDDFANILGLRQGYEWRTHLPSDPTPPGMRPE